MATTDLTAALEAEGVDYELLPHAHTETALAEAHALGVDPRDVAKTLVVSTGAGYVRAVVPAETERLDLRKLRELLGASKKEVQLASERELARDYRRVRPRRGSADRRQAGRRRRDRPQAPRTRHARRRGREPRRVDPAPDRTTSSRRRTRRWQTSRRTRAKRATRPRRSRAPGRPEARVGTCSYFAGERARARARPPPRARARARGRAAAPTRAPGPVVRVRVDEHGHVGDARARSRSAAVRLERFGFESTAV